MKRQSLKGQALLMTAMGAAVRGGGLIIRLILSRVLGAEAMGIMELASGVHMLALTPGTAGLPGAVSRLTARAPTEEEQAQVLFAGRRWALRMALWVMPAFFLFTPLLSSLLGDTRTLPSLYCFLPCVLLSGAASAYDGFFLGRGQALPPMLSEGGEQAVRLAFLLLFSPLMLRVTVAWRAGLAALAGLMGEGVGLLIVMLFARGIASAPADPVCLRREISRLSLPALLNRLSHTGLRALSNWLIPRQLAVAGLAHREALSQLGMLNGMVMPLIFLPGLAAGSLALVGGPAIARCRTPLALRRLFFRLMGAALAVGLAATGLLFLFAPRLSVALYHLPELTPLLRALSPLALMLSLHQVTSGIMTGLGMQKRALGDALLGAAFTLFFTFLWTPTLGILGAGLAALVGHCASFFSSMVHLIGRIFFPSSRT